MKGAVPNVRKAKAIHEKKQAERNATAHGQQDEEARGGDSPRTLTESGCPGGDVSRPPRSVGQP